MAEPPDGSRSPGRLFSRAVPWFFAAVLAYVVLSDVLGAGLVARGDPAPGLDAALADGSAFDLASRRGHVTVLNFWATWCPPCREEAPELSRVHARIAPRGGMVVGFSGDHAPLARIAVVARDLGMTYPIARATADQWERFRISRLPTTYIVDASGRIAWSHVGPLGADTLLEAIDDVSRP